MTFTNSFNQSPSVITGSFSSSEKNSQHFVNTEDHNRIHKSSARVPIPSQTNPALSSTRYPFLELLLLIEICMICHSLRAFMMQVTK